MRNKIPHWFTACEEYRGFTIAIYQGSYKGFSYLSGNTAALSTRAAVRDEIDGIVDNLQRAFAS